MFIYGENIIPDEFCYWVKLLFNYLLFCEFWIAINRSRAFQMGFEFHSNKFFVLLYAFPLPFTLSSSLFIYLSHSLLFPVFFWLYSTTMVVYSLLWLMRNIIQFFIALWTMEGVQSVANAFFVRYQCKLFNRIISVIPSLYLLSSVITDWKK